ncbi:MAG: aminodeoxychorismate lyase, protein [Parcubacteria group bacterium]|nr:aminodeoxychorismate lyase, protein [Parcubacteria group bacterium]
MQFDIGRSEQQNTRAASLRALYETYRIWLTGIAVLLIVGITVVVWLFSPPSNFPANSLITISKDAPASTFGATLADAHLIRSEFLFKVLARITGFDHHLDTGAYVFKKPASLISVLRRIHAGQHGIEAVHITFTEGMTHYDMADTLEAQLPGFNRSAFLNAASTSEGYLFPDTYFFMPGDSGDDIVIRLKSQFSQSIATITPQILASRHKFSDAVILASILEREAKTEEDKRIVAGILWNRIAKGMPLQVDAVFGYIHKENGYTPTAEDLASNSPYNTYRNKGLPPTAISNPGIESLLAAVTPAQTKYFYYLTGNDGKMHYAVTFDQHKKNVAQYLK